MWHQWLKWVGLPSLFCFQLPVQLAVIP